ncbi:MAG: hypothetical protein GY866_43745 [Proteobacteria bacterium]|nr:hypothetical protein [Pseudomonadota bacterium]
MSHERFTRSIWFAIGVSISSGVLISLSMPNYNVGFLGWIGLVPLFMLLLPTARKYPFWLAMPCGTIWSIAAHHWYLTIFGPNPINDL